MVTQRRHPLFNRLARPLPPIYPDAVTPVAWDDDQPIDDMEGIVYVVTRPCAQMRTWARQLRARHRADRTHETGEGLSPLSAAPIRANSLGELGVAVDMFGRSGRKVRTAQAGHWLYLDVTLMAIVVEKVGGDAVGFVSFGLKWAVSADDRQEDDVRFEVEPDQAWIAPEFRGRRWGELAAIAIAMTTRAHIKQVQDSTRWPKGFTVPLKVMVCADIYSTSGEAFLQLCAQYVDMQLDFDFWRELDQFKVTDVEFDPRW